MKSEELSTKLQLKYVGMGVLIAVAYVVWFIVITGWIEDDFSLSGNSFLPNAHAQIQPFELELQQIRNPEECTRKVIQGASAYIPFTIKIFYDTTNDRKWDVISKGQTFPVAQQTAQVATFFTPEIDQYQLYLEVNYADKKERQAYIEIVSEGNTVWNHQEKFDDSKLCMNFHINTSEPPSFPTREELIGDLLSNVDQIPEMITSYNVNTITWNNSIGYMWTLLAGVFILSVLTLISARVSSRGFGSKMKDIDESVNLVNQSALEMDKMNENFTKNSAQIIKNQKVIVKNMYKILEETEIDVAPPEESKISKLKHKIIHPKKEIDEIGEEDNTKADEELEDDVKETLEFPTKEQKQENAKLVDVIEKEVKEPEPSGGFIKPEDLGLAKEEEKVSPPTPPLPKEEVIPKPERKPEKFKQILRGINFKGKAFKEGEFEKYTYNELNNMYGWIVHYKKRKVMNGEWEDIPEDMRTKQDIAEKVIYYAIFTKMEKKMRNGK